MLLVQKPEKVDHIDAAGCIGDVIKAYTALHYQARVCSGETVLILNGASVSMRRNLNLNLSVFVKQAQIMGFMARRKVRIMQKREERTKETEESESKERLHVSTFFTFIWQITNHSDRTLKKA